ncbi:HD domain-containing protein [Nocardia abscessus]|uniref:HD domain-containing protein n=1 Tax=Nocardia abscessus TaxID=120957 RepID=UPI0024579CC2|nr:HD domain-containing protein [Nocardia abscessus]
MTGDLASWAEQLAHSCLTELPRRWRHVQGVVRQAERAADAVDDPDLLIAAAWVHDIGYTSEAVQSGCHAVDGAAFLRDRGAPERLCALVAHHSCARVEARYRDVPITWPDEQTPLRDALWWADMTTTPTGSVTGVRERIAEVQERYGPKHVVAQSVTEAAPFLLEAADRTEGRLKP